MCSSDLRPVVDAFSVGILLNTEDRTIQEWADDFLLSNSPCLEGSTGGELDQLSFTEVYGLWVLIVGSIVLGMIIMAGKRYHKHRRNPEWGRELPMDMSSAGSADLARKFMRGDSRETKTSDLYRIESDLH